MKPRSALERALDAGRISRDAFLFLRQDGRCIWCKRPMTLIQCTDSGSKMTVEHIKPKAEGGTDKRSNLAMACRRCNHLRGTLPAGTFLALAKAYGPHLPEIGTPRWQRLNTQLRHFASGTTRRIRIPYRSAPNADSRV